MVKLKPKSRQWIVDEHGCIIIGEGRQEILENIEKTGSINQTSKIMRMSYKAVWSKIKTTEKYLGTRLVNTDRKSGSHLTQEGKQLLDKYRLYKKKCIQEDNKIFSRIFNQNDPEKGKQE